MRGKRRRSSTQVDDNQNTLKKLARCAPPNYLHKHHLVEAERLRVLDGESDAIMHHYDQAIALARESEFIHYDWPGNVRELQNTLHRYVTLGKVDFLGKRMKSKISETSNFGDSINHRKIVLDQTVADYEKATILSALKNSQGHKVKTASALGISRATLFNKMKKYGIRTKSPLDS